MKLKTFIPLECDLFYDDRMSALINHAGVKGYGIYLILIVELRKRKNYCLDAESLKTIARTYHIRRKSLDDVLYNYDLFTVKLMPAGNLLITSEYVTRVMRNYDEKVARCSESEEKIADKGIAAQSERPLDSVATTEQNITEKKTSEEKEKKEETTAAAPVAAAPIPVPIPVAGTLTGRRLFRSASTQTTAPPGRLNTVNPHCYIAIPLPAI